MYLDPKKFKKYIISFTLHNNPWTMFYYKEEAESFRFLNKMTDQGMLMITSQIL